MLRGRTKWIPHINSRKDFGHVLWRISSIESGHRGTAVRKRLEDLTLYNSETIYVKANRRECATIYTKPVQPPYELGLYSALVINSLVVINFAVGFLCIFA